MDCKRKQSSRLPMIFLPFFLFLFFNTPLSLATDTIPLHRPLSGNHTIVSKDGNFELGFFTPGNASNYYIGIWYKKIPIQTVIWVANRAIPITNTSSAKLKISKTGNLILLNSSKVQIWSSHSTASTLNATAAVLLDTGNLILRNKSTTLWQSFDHPTDTWMPGERLGMNKRTGEYQSLTCWENPENPAPGPFVQSLDPRGSNQYFFLWNGSQVYSSSGLWNGKFFPSHPIIAVHTAFHFTFTDDKERKYGMYIVTDSSLITRYVLDSAGQGKQWIWFNNSQAWQSVFIQPLAHCDVYSLCGPFSVCHEQSPSLCQCCDGFTPASTKEWELNDWNSGCVRKTQLQCANKSTGEEEKDGFLLMSNTRLPSHAQNLMAGSAKECQENCSNNCSCVAYSFNGSCSIWTADLRNLQALDGNVSGGADLFLRLAASDLPSSGSSHKSSTVVVASIVAGVLAILFVICVIIGAHFWHREKSSNGDKVEGSVVIYSYNDLLQATKNFSDELGGGGFGAVFKGTLPDSTEVAVKKLKEGFRQGDKQFRSEVSTLGAIQHVNLIRLCGFCCEGDRKLLVYEYMPEGSLASQLFSKEHATVLDWRTRYKIILGIARGLAYLHESCRERIIHCDIKPDNILLDSDFSAKVADFGMAKLVGRNFSRVLTTMRGTVGYLAPEWISGLPITPKVDVYSFGMVLLEVISGKRNTMHSEDGSKSFYPSWAARRVIEGNMASILDHRLDGEADMEELLRASRVACWCIQDSEADRPTMGQVVQILEGAVEVNTPPLPMALQHLVENQTSPVYYFSSAEQGKSETVEGSD